MKYDLLEDLNPGMIIRVTIYLVIVLISVSISVEC